MSYLVASICTKATIFIIPRMEIAGYLDNFSLNSLGKH